MTPLRNHLSRALVPSMIAIAIAATTQTATAQVTLDQQSAIRASCRSDFTSKCSGVTPGGKDALVCLQENVAGLSPACKTAVSATMPAAAPAAATAPPAPPPAAATTAPAVAPPAQAPAPRTVTPAPPPPAATSRPAAPKPQQAQKPAAPPKQAVTAPPTPVAPPPASASPPATHAPKAPVVMTAVIGRACLRDLIRHCRDIQVGDGQKIACLTAHADSLTPVCRAAMNITTPLR